MKNIKKFKDYSSTNESSFQILKSAAEKLNKLGKGARARKLHQWSLTKETYKYGSMKLDICSGITNIDWNGNEVKEYRIDHFSPIVMDKTVHKKYKYTDIKTPVEVYFANIFVNYITEPSEISEIFNDDISTMEAIPISVVFTEADTSLKSENIMPFNIDINIKWVSDEKFEVENVSVVHPWSDFDDKAYVFADRKSSNIFSKNILKESFLKENCYNELWKPLRDFFFEYSTPKDFEKAFDLISKLNHYQLCTI